MSICRQVLWRWAAGTNFWMQLQPDGLLRRLDVDTCDWGVIGGTLTFVSALFEHDLNDPGRHPQMDGHMHQLLMTSPLWQIHVVMLGIDSSSWMDSATLGGGSKRDSCGLMWIHLESFLTHLDSFGLRVQLDPLGFSRSYWNPIGITWAHSNSIALTWAHLGWLFEFTWTYSLSLGPATMITTTHVGTHCREKEEGLADFSNNLQKFGTCLLTYWGHITRIVMLYYNLFAGCMATSWMTPGEWTAMGHKIILWHCYCGDMTSASKRTILWIDT